MVYHAFCPAYKAHTLRKESKCSQKRIKPAVFSPWKRDGSFLVYVGVPPGTFFCGIPVDAVEQCEWPLRIEKSTWKYTYTFVWQKTIHPNSSIFSECIGIWCCLWQTGLSFRENKQVRYIRINTCHGGESEYSYALESWPFLLISNMYGHL